MVDEGPTTVGSIVGKLRMDRDVWKTELAATKQDIRDLESASPNVHVKATTGEAIAGLKATESAASRVERQTDKVSAAEVRLAAALRAADSAYARAGLAQMRLNELRDKGVTTGARLTAAELAATEALHRLDAANEKATASETRLAAAQQAAAAAASQEAAAQAATRHERVKANEANATAVTRLGALTTAVVLLAPLLAPVGAAAVGIGGAFLGMGAAGVLAMIGIHREMNAGTPTISLYRAGIDQLKGDFRQLSTMAAVAMLRSFQRSVVEIHGNMPMLNTQVAQFSSLLGRSGTNLLTGAINGLRILNPLFLTAGVYVERLTAGFQLWTENGGLEKFGGYALSMLPTVTETLGRLASMVMHILEALAPLGEVGLVVLSGIATAINAIPVEILSQLIASITWGAVAFKAWGLIAPMLSTVASAMGAVGVATTIATGPIGWVVAGLSALAGIFAVVIAQNSGATQAMQDYTAAVDADSGAIRENVRLKAIQKLQDDGALAAAKKLGISTETVVSATLGNASAQKQLNAVLESGKGTSDAAAEARRRSGLSLVDYGVAVTTLSQAVDRERDGIAGQITRYKELQDALGESARVTTTYNYATRAAAGALGISLTAVEAAASSQKDMKAETEKATAEMYFQNNAAGLLKQALDLLNGKAIDAAQAQNQFDSSLANMGAHIDKTGKDVDRATTSLVGMSAAAVANRGELISSVQAAQNAAQAYRDNGASSDEARQKLIDMKNAIIEHAVELGEDRNQVQAFIEKIFQIPASIPPTKVEVDTAAANRKLDDFQERLRNVARLTDNFHTANGEYGRGLGVLKPPGTANGGTIGDAVRGLAGGGTGGTVNGPGTAGSDTAGLFRLARGEEVISNIFGQADRNRALLKQINAGYTPVSQSQSTATPATVSAPEVHQHFYITGTQQEDPRVLGMIVGGEVSRALVGVKK